MVEMDKVDLEMRQKELETAVAGRTAEEVEEAAAAAVVLAVAALAASWRSWVRNDSSPTPLAESVVEVPKG